MKITTDSCLFGAWVANDIGALMQENNILDIGSGSGLLCLMMAQQTQAHIDGIEIQDSDYRQSIENIANAAFGDRITIYHANALQFDFTKKYDAIISNPPFYESDLKGTSKGKNVAHHNEGIRLNELLFLIKNNLQNLGSFYLLLPQKRLANLEKLLTNNNLYINKIVWVHQSENHDPFRILVKGSLHQSNCDITHINIKCNNHYSASFIQLLSSYYLHL